MDDPHNRPTPYSAPAAPEEATRDSQPTTDSGQRSKSTTGLMIGVLVLLLAVAGFAAYHFFGNQIPGLIGDDAVPENTDETGPVAIVNGKEIPRQLYNENIERVTAQAAQQGIDPENPQVAAEIQNQVIESLINTELLLQAAAEENIEPSTEAVDEQLAAIITQFGGREALEAEMKTLNLTEAEVRADISEQIAVNELISRKVDVESITISDAEVEEFYNSIAAQNPEMPPLTEVRPQIEAELRAQKEQQMVQQMVEQLRSQAEIQILIETPAE